MMLTFDSTRVMQVADGPQLSQRIKDDGFRPVTVQTVDYNPLEALERLVRLLREPCLIPSLAPLMTEEIVICLLSGAHGPQPLHVIMRIRLVRKSRSQWHGSG
jgi:hypothetical protein